MSLFSERKTIKLRIEGMHCEKCVARVRAALEKVNGVTSAQVSLEHENALVEGHLFDNNDLIAAVTQAGFSAEVNS